MDRVRLGVIGCGSMSRYHGRIFTQSVPEAEIVALVEPDANNLARYIADVFPEGAARDEGRQFPICKPEPLAELFRNAGLQEITTCALDAPTVFANFDDYWSPFL